MPIKNLNNEDCEIVSNCCNAELKTNYDEDEGIGFYSCKNCGKGCNGTVETPTKVNVGLLRQWLNENRIDDVKKMVSDEEILKWLEL